MHIEDLRKKIDKESVDIENRKLNQAEGYIMAEIEKEYRKNRCKNSILLGLLRFLREKKLLSFFISTIEKKHSDIIVCMLGLSIGFMLYGFVFIVYKTLS
jgi:hypothetical protein